MCGTGTVGQKTFVAPAASTATNTTQVAGAAGGGSSVAGATGGGGDLMSTLAPMLQQVTSAIEALRQALTGAGVAVGGGHGAGHAAHGGMAGCDMMGGGHGGPSTAVADASGGAEATGGGHGHGGMAGCDMMGGGASDYAVPVTSTDVADASGGGDATGPNGKDSAVAGDSGDAKGKDTAVAGETGAPAKTAVAGETGAPAKSDVAGETGAPGKSDVGGVGGDPTQVGETPTQKLDAAKVDGAAKAEAVKAADADVVARQGAVETAQAAVTAAQRTSVDADGALVDAGQALEAARTGHGSHTTGASDTLASIAAKHGVTVATLRSLNPEVTVLGTLPAGTKVKLPKGVGVEAAVAEATGKLDAARTAAAAARKAVEDAIAALNAAREALRAAEAAAKAATEAADAAAKAVVEAQKAADVAAAAAATTEAGGPAAPAPAAGDTASVEPKTRTVAPGDTLSSIARAAGLASWQELYELNKDVIGTDPNRILPGQVLKLPSGAAGATAAAPVTAGGGSDRTTRPVGNTGSPATTGQVDDGDGSNGAPPADEEPAPVVEAPPKAPGPDPAQRERLVERRGELQAEKQRLTDLLAQHGGGAGTQSAVERIRVIDQALREIAAALNGRAA